MMSMRYVARSVPRTLTRISSAAIRQTTVARPSSLLKTAWAPLRSSQLTSSFSTTPLRKAPAGEVDEELSLKLASELQFESEMKENDEQPTSVKDFLENNPFELIDTPGKQDVIMKRKFGNETITVTFSITDLSSFDSNDIYSEDQALTDEQMESPEAQSRAMEEEEEDLDIGDEENAGVPCRLSVVVEKEGQGALTIDALAQDGQIVVENFYHYKDPAHAHANSAEVVHAAGNVYPGPPFGSLDEDLQILMERYLEERGITQALAVFVPDYMDVKEQREYQTWLKGLKGFIDA